MGYSLGVRFKTAQEQEEMYQFYLSNTDIIESLSNAEGRQADVERFTDLHFDLSYSPQVKHLMGYDGPSGVPYYYQLLLAWMAVKSTYRDKSNEPFIYYDHEKIKVNQKNFLSLQLNKNGLPTSETILNLINENKLLAFDLFLVTDFEEYSKKLEALFNQLDERWNEFQLKSNKEQTKKSKP